MAKSDAPALRLVVQSGPKLAPASDFDAERLDGYKIGRVLRLTPVEEADRKDIRRWWAILNRAVKDTKTPWRTATQASEAIKLALGIVEYGKTVGGQFMQWPLSLKELDDKDLADAVRDMASLLHKMTGVDPLEWNRETADVGRDEQPADFSDAGSGSSGAEIGSDTPSPAAAPTSASGGPAEDGSDTGATVGDEPSSDMNPLTRMIMEECVDNMLRDAFSDPASDRLEKVNKCERVFLEPQNLGAQAGFVRRCAETARRIIGKPHERSKAHEYLMGHIK